MTWKMMFFIKKIYIYFLSLTAVGYSKTVRHFQIVNVGRQSEFWGAKLNHSYPKCAVLLIRTPWKESSWKPKCKHQLTLCILFSCKTHFAHKKMLFYPSRFFFCYVGTNGYLPIWTLGEPPSAHPHKTSRTETDKFTIFSMVPQFQGVHIHQGSLIFL